MGPLRSFTYPFLRLGSQTLRLLSSALPTSPAEPSVRGTPRRTVVIVEPSLTSAGGHELEIALAAARTYREMGFDVHVLANRRFSPLAGQGPIPDAIEPIPAFGSTVYDTFTGSPVAPVTFAGDAASYAADLAFALGRLEIPRPDLLVFPTSSIVQLFGATLLRPSFLRADSEERQAHLFYYDPRSPFLAAPSPYGPRIHRAVFRLLRAQLAKGRLRLVGDSAATVAGLRSVGVHEAEEIALPITARSGKGRSGGRLVASFLGGVRAAKGAHLLPEIVAQALARAPTVRLIIQAHLSSPIPALQAVVARLRAIQAPADRLTLLEHPLSSEAYAALLGESDILVLPYDPDVYRTATSGVCLEGLVSARVMVGPEEGWIADRGREGGAYVGVDTRSPTAVVDGIVAASARFAELAARARESAPRFAARHDPGAFAARLAGWQPRPVE